MKCGLMAPMEKAPNGKKQVYDFNRWYELIRRLQPTATIAIMGPDVRWVGTETGRGREMEWSVIPADPNMMAKLPVTRRKMLHLHQREIRGKMTWAVAIK